MVFVHPSVPDSNHDLLMASFQFFEYTSQKEIRYNTHQPEACVAVQAGAEILVMELCQDLTPENHQFLLRPVSGQCGPCCQSLGICEETAAWELERKAFSSVLGKWLGQGT